MTILAKRCSGRSANSNAPREITTKARAQHPARAFFAKKFPRGQGWTNPARHRTMQDMSTDDADLAQAAANGDGDAFAALLDRVYDRIFALAFRMTGTRNDAEDLTQDICAALPMKIRRYDRRAAFTTWLYRVVVNAAHDRRRRAQTHAKAAAGWGDWERARQSDIAETRDQMAWLQAAMRALPEDLRDTLALTLDEITHRDAAEILGVSEGTISWRVSEAKKHLRRMKQEEDLA